MVAGAFLGVGTLYYSVASLSVGSAAFTANVLFIGNEGWFKSVDGGKTFRNSPAPHGDHHDIWINPKNSQIMIQCNDGGANVSIPWDTAGFANGPQTITVTVRDATGNTGSGARSVTVAN